MMVKRSPRGWMYLTAVLVSLASERAHSGIKGQSLSSQGINGQGINGQGINGQGINGQGINGQGINGQGINGQGINGQGINGQGINGQGINGQGINGQGINGQGINGQGINGQGAALRGIDRARAYLNALQFRGISRAYATIPGNVQGLQSGAPVDFVEVANPMAGVRLQRGPTDPSLGSYIYVPGLSGTANDIKGSFWNMVLADTCQTSAQCPASATCTEGACIRACTSDSQCGSEKCVQGSCTDVLGGIALYIADVETDRGLNLSTSPSNDDIYLYTVYYRQPATGQWAALCPTDDQGRQRAMAIPLNPNDWSSDASRATMAFACTASGVAAKCARSWGYKPWRGDDVLADEKLYYDTCLIAARAAYCQDDQSFTRDGTMVDLFDVIPFPHGSGSYSFNASNGLSLNPFDQKPMLHEEYQISVVDKVIRVIPPEELAAMDGALQLFLAKLQTSGLQSSRYPDLDPGRSCAAAPYIDRCTEQGVCTRAGNRPPGFYDRMLAVNSPRHCTHRENETGEPMIPSCSACTARICEVEPTCCGDPQGNMFVSSLVWDSRCTDLRAQLCRSTPLTGGLDNNLWPLGKLADSHVGEPVRVLRGAIGSFEQIVTEGGINYVEGWACDPDFPTAPSPIQIAYGAPLGMEGSVLMPGVAADAVLPRGWRETVSAECGGGERHGFRVALPPQAGNQFVYIYGIDLNVPGAPFSLLRGGRKNVPTTTIPRPRAMIYTGWVEPEVSDTYVFDAPVGPTDKFRLWVNGSYVAGNWKDPVTTPPTPGAFTEDPPTSPRQQFLQKGIRYAMRLEYLRPDTLTTSGTSRLQVTWARPLSGIPASSIPTTALYPMAQSIGNGLQGTYYPGLSSLAALPPPADITGARPERTYAAVDHVWNDSKPPLPGLLVGDSFAARFEGQIMPAISGDYTFSLDTDGDARVVVKVNGIDIDAVTSASRRPDVPKPDVPENECAHDICATGAQMSTSCDQNNFCALEVCRADRDPACCTQTWDARCVDEVNTYCAAPICTPTTGGITLNAGWKYDIRVEYHHQGSLPDEEVRGGKLKLMWSLPGSPRDVVPVERLFAAAADAPKRGTGVNAAYFTNATFQDEYFNRVEPSIFFQATAPLPVATRPSSMICGGVGAPTCDPAPVSAVQPMFPLGPLAMELTLVGGGFVPGATLTLFEYIPPDEQNPQGRLVSLGTPNITPGPANTFSTRVILSRRRYILKATQTVGGQTSDINLSKTFILDVTDPAAPLRPPVNQPSVAPAPGGGTVTTTGTKAVPNTTVTVTVTRTEGGTTTTVATRQVTTGPTGDWNATLFVAPPGSYDLTVTQVSGASTSDGTTVKIAVPVPVLNVTEPADNLTVTCPAQTCLVSVRGSGATPALGPVIVADGEAEKDAAGNVLPTERFFIDLPTLPPAPPAIVPAANGTFAGDIALDHGRHRLKIFQRSNGLDGDGTPRTVIVRPPASAVAVSFPGSGAVIDSEVTVTGSGPARQGFRELVSVYQVPRGVSACPATAGAGTQKLGTATIDDDGRFLVPVTVQGVGLQCLAVSHTVSSLSGAGPAEGELSPVITVRVRPEPPTITEPRRTGDLRFSSSLNLIVAGTAHPGSRVTIYAERPNAQPFKWPPVTGPFVTASSEGTYATTVPLPAVGTHRLSATATVEGAESVQSEPPVVVAVGDVIPPTLKISDPADPARRAVREIPATATSDTGVAFNFAQWVTAIDPSPNGGAGTQLPANQITCQPAVGSLFPLGATPVTCTAADGAGNTGSTTFLLVVRKTESPAMIGSNLTAVAVGSGGAPVNYQITSTGLITDCSAAGSGAPEMCTGWKPASAGLGVNVTALARNPVTGALYAAVGDRLGGRVFKSTNGGATWQELAKPGGEMSFSSIVAGSGPSPTLAILPPGGLVTSRDDGQTWSTALPGTPLKGVAVDPRDGGHLLAWNEQGSGISSALWETRDAGQTWSNVTGKLPNTQILAVAIDPVNTERTYAALLGGIDPEQSPFEQRLIRIFRRVPGGEWKELPVLEFADTFPVPPRTMFVASAAGPAGSCPTGDPLHPFPAVFVGRVYSCDGGDTWLPIKFVGPISEFFLGFDNMVFDASTPGKIHASGSGVFTELFTSVDHGNTWTASRAPEAIKMEAATFVQHPGTGALLAAAAGRGIVRSQDGGQTWTAANTGLPVALGAYEIAVDPADPATAYLALGRAGIFKTTNGGASWEARNAQLHFVDTGFTADKIVVHPLARNVIFSGSITGGIAEPSSRSFGFKWGISPDGGATWTRLVDWRGVPFLNAGLAADPLSVGAWLAFTGGGEDRSLEWTTGEGDHPLAGGPHGIFRLQMVPNQARTVVASLVSQNEQTGRTVLFSFMDLLLGLSPPPFVDIGLTGPANVVYDASDGEHRLYVGGKALGRDENLLYRAKLTDLLNPTNPLEPHQWEELRGDDVFPAFQRLPHIWGRDTDISQESFTTLVIDPAGGGQTMYTLGSENTLWVSRDGGHSWKRDDMAAGWVTGIWLSPVDGVVYADISPVFRDTAKMFYAGDAVEGFPSATGRGGVPWKRVAGGIVPGARIAKGDVRVTCQGPAGFMGSSTPGSTFPIGNTVLTCSATDVFGNANTQAFTVSVTPRPATNPAPANNATGVATNATLSWTAGTGATSHDVYFGTTNPPPSQGNRTGTTFNPGTLAGSTTYFWRIDERGLGGVTTGTVWRFTTAAAPPTAATNPNPAHLATGVARNATLSWTAGVGATSRDVFFGTSNPPPSQGNRTTTTFTPSTMTANTTYFWRINERNSTGVTTGTVWRFTTGTGSLPGAATNPNPTNNTTGVATNATLSWTAGSGATSRDVFFGTSNPPASQGNRTTTTFTPSAMTANTKYFWRIDERNATGVRTGTVWSFTTAGPLPGAASNPNPANNATAVAINATLSWTAGSGATSHDVFFGTSNPPASQGNRTTTTFTPSALAASTTYFWRIDERNAAGVRTGTVWSFTTRGALPGAASSPGPSDNATGVQPWGGTVAWVPGVGATSHDVFFGTSNPPEPRPNQTGTSFDAGALAPNTTYFWRIDERNVNGVTPGPVWRFTTTTYFVSSMFLNGWTNAPLGTNDASVAVASGKVYLRGAINTTGMDPHAFNLLGPYGPNTDVYVPITLCGSNKGRLHIQPDGTTSVQVEGGNWADAQCMTSLDGASYALSASGYTALTLQDGWTNAPYSTRNAAFRNINGTIHLQGAIGNGTTGAVFTMPAGARPSTDVYVPVDLCGATKGRLLIQPSGAVYVGTLGPFSDAQCFVSLEGVSYALTSTGYTALTLENGWVNAPYSTRSAAVRNDNGVIGFQGAVSSGSDAPVFTLPAGMRPSKDVYVPVDLCNAQRGQILIQPSGSVSVQSAGSFGDAQCFTSLEGAWFGL